MNPIAMRYPQGMTNLIPKLLSDSYHEAVLKAPSTPNPLVATYPERYTISMATNNAQKH